MRRLVSCFVQALLVGGIILLTLPNGTAAQPRPAAPARDQWKGIWEPVSFTEDLDLTDVFFVTADVGWAAGAGGTIIHTRDGGATWTAQLGGEPGSAEAKITMLRFVDEHRGWALQGKKLLHTSNGKDWEEVSGALPNWMSEYTFIGGRRGVASGTTSSQGFQTEVFLTQDGGHAWKPVARCAIRAMVDGVNRNFSCIVDQFHFPTPRVGYLVAHIDCVGVGCGGPPTIGKTEDGGDSWRFIVGPGDIKTTRLMDIFFVDERVGFVHATNYPGDPKLFATADGGETWKGVVGSPGKWLRFADPEVGWGFHEYKLSYTTDGGGRWSSRPHRFPTNPRAISFPRRDRGYVAGDHGMVFRYRVVPAAEATKPEVIVTAAMPSFGSPLGEQMTEVNTAITELKAAVEKAPAGGQPASAPALDTTAAAAEGAEAAPASAFTASCCGKPLNKLSTVLAALVQTLPQFSTKFKNTNLLGAAVRMLTVMPSQLLGLRSALKAFKQAGDKEAAQQAVAQIAAAAGSLHQSAKAALQVEVPPPSEEPGSGQGGDGQPSVEATADTATTGAVDSTMIEAKKKVSDEVKKKAGGLLKKKIRIP